MNQEESPERDRAAGRRDWPIKSFALGDEPGDDLSPTTTPEERLAMVWPLTLEAWTLAGLPLPDYERKDTPITVVTRTP